MENKIRVIVADDSGFMRLIVTDILTSDTSIEVIDTAEDGKEAYEKTLKHKPDVVLLDMIMPKYDGTYAIEKIMDQCPTPIVVLSSLGHSNINPILKAIDLGAFDYLNKPVKGMASLRNIDNEIIRKVRLAAKSDVTKTITQKKTNVNEHVFAEKLPYDVIVVGASTGGPKALEVLLTNLPSNLSIPLLIAQHMPENFVPSFALRLNMLVTQQVEVGRKGMIVKPGMIIIAPGNRNMIVNKNNKTNDVLIDYSFKKFDEYNHPSVNALMISAADTYGERTLAAILTGMGKDGAKGIAEIKRKGGYTVAQNKESCAVFGMPREAIQTNSIDSVVSINEMGGFLTSCLS